MVGTDSGLVSVLILVIRFTIPVALFMIDYTVYAFVLEYII